MTNHPPPRLDPEWVRRVQRLIGAKPTGTFDVESIRKLKLWQATADLPTTGYLDHATWSKLHDHLDAKKKPVPLQKPFKTSPTTE